MALFQFPRDLFCFAVILYLMFSFTMWDLFLGTVVTGIIFVVVYDGPMVLVKPDGIETVLVTGAGSGIGKHATLSLAHEGYTVFAGVQRSREKDALLAHASGLGFLQGESEEFVTTTYGGKIIPIILDVSKSDHIRNAFETISDHIRKDGRLFRGLVHNAGGSPMSKSTHAIEYMGMETFRETFNEDFFGTVETTQKFLPLLRKSGGGRIVINTSVEGYTGYPFVGAYSSSKFALDGFAESLRHEVTPEGISVSVIKRTNVVTPAVMPNGMNNPQDDNNNNGERNNNHNNDNEPPQDFDLYGGGYKKKNKKNYERDQQWNMVLWKNAYRNTVGAPYPIETSKAIVHAIRGQYPKARYSVGTYGIMIKMLSLLPQNWIDHLVASSNAKPVFQFTPDEVRNMMTMETANADPYSTFPRSHKATDAEL